MALFQWLRGGGRTRPETVQALRNPSSVRVVDRLVHDSTVSVRLTDCGSMHMPMNNHITSATNIHVFIRSFLNNLVLLIDGRQRLSLVNMKARNSLSTIPISVFIGPELRISTLVAFFSVALFETIQRVNGQSGLPRLIRTTEEKIKYQK